jgi:hypothetical protein
MGVDAVGGKKLKWKEDERVFTLAQPKQKTIHQVRTSTALTCTQGP